MARIMQRFPEYFVQALDDSIFYEAMLLRDKYKTIVPQGILRTDQNFPIGFDFRESLDGHRTKFAYAIDEQSAVKGLNYADKNPHWPFALAILQITLRDYLRKLRAHIVTHEKEDVLLDRQGVVVTPTRFSEHMKTVIRESAQASFQQELLPVMSFFLQEAGGDVSEKNFAKALCQTFRAEAMQSTARRMVPKQVDTKIVTTKCPFGPVLGRLSHMVLEEDADGVITVSDEKRPGAFFYFLYQKAQEFDERFNAEMNADRQDFGIAG